jgi:hypothetical protein
VDDGIASEKIPKGGGAHAAHAIGLGLHGRGTARPKRV